MRTRKPIKLPAEYQDTPERRVLDLGRDGMPCIPILGHDTYLKIRKVSPPHVHPECVEISYCLRGDLEFVLGKKVYPFRPGSVFVTRPDERHYLRTWPKGISKYWMLFRIPERGGTVLGLSRKESDWLVDELLHLPRPLFEGGEEVLRNFKRIFRLYDTLPRRTSERGVRMRAAALELILSVIESSKTSDRVFPDVRFKRIAAAIAEHPERDYPFEFLVEQAGMSRTSFLSRFKKAIGFPPHAYVVKCRIDKAKVLLEQGMSVGAISDRLGFSSPRHFTAAFRATTGRLPSKWVSP